MRVVALLALLGCGFVSCVSATYRPPVDTSDPSEFTRVVNRPYDETWDALIDHLATTYFGIDNYEYDSGLLTLSFGADDPGTFVNGGHWTYKQDFLDGNQTIDFKGNYVDFLSIYRNGNLMGRMNIVVRPKGPNKSVVTVNTRYVFRSIWTEITTGVVTNDTWSFNSGGSDTVLVAMPAAGTTASRTLIPTHEAERSILNALNALGNAGPVARKPQQQGNALVAGKQRR